MLDTPNHGTFLAVQGLAVDTNPLESNWDPSTSQMVPGSVLLRKLNDVEEKFGSVYYLTIGCESDSTVPKGSAEIKGGFNYGDINCSHSGIYDPEITPEAYEFVLKALDKNFERHFKKEENLEEKEENSKTSVKKWCFFKWFCF